MIKRSLLYIFLLICAAGFSAPSGGTTTTCQYSTATLVAAGTGAWSALGSNPTTTVIDSLHDSTTVITGFSVAGTYKYIWLSGGVGDTFTVDVIAKPNAGINQAVACYNTGTATMAASGAGTWTALLTNPSFTIITNPASPTTTIHGFHNPGVYYYVWTVNGCTDTATVTAGSVTNDNCTGAVSMGTLAAPAACNANITAIKRGATTTLTGQTNTCASPSFPFYYQVNCPANLTSPPNDVWYSFVASSNEAVISVTGASFANPTINVWGGTCTTLEGLGCASGSGGADSLVVYQLTPGVTYYIQVYGADSAQTGTFNISAYGRTDCSQCVLASSFTATPPPTNGYYYPGETVTFCYTVSNWTQIAVDWLHGVTPSFGNGWDLSTLVPGTPPATLGGDGVWSWYPQGDVSAGGSGASFGAGFYFESEEGSPNGVADNNPGNNYGDDATGPWQPFCVTISVRNDTTCTSGANLSVSFYPTSDYQSGSWDEAACETDSTTAVSVVGGCCPPTLSTTSASCSHNDGTATAVPHGSHGPWTLTWSNGIVQRGVTGASTITALYPGEYCVTVTDQVGCGSVSCDSVHNSSEPDGGGTKYVSCPSVVDSVLMTANGTGVWSILPGNPGPSTIVSPDSANTPIKGFTALGTYHYKWTIGNCSDTVAIVVSSRPNAGDTVSTCIGGTAQLLATGTGTWTILPGNPAPTVITNPTYDSTTVTGFSVGGRYGYIWSVNVCADTTYINVPVFTSSATIHDTSLCKFQTTTLTATAGPAGLGPFTYSWSPAAGVVSPNSATTATTPVLQSTTYYVTVTSAGGCALVDSVSVALAGAAPQVTITPSNNNVCPGDTVTLNGLALAENLVSCGVPTNFSYNCTPVEEVVKNDTSSSTGFNGTTNIYGSPFSGSFNSYRVQYIFTKAELNAAGLSSGTITDISFFVKAVNSTLAYDTFTVSMGCTNQDSFTTDFINNLQVVLGPLYASSAFPEYPNQGWSPLLFTNYYNWDGVSNLVVQVCYTINSNLNSADDYVSYSTTSYSGSTIYAADASGNGCSLDYVTAPSGEILNTRPNIKFDICVPNVLTYQWSPSTILCDTCPVTQVVVNSNKSDTLTVNDNGCVGSAVVNLTVNTNIGVTATAGATPDTSLCHADTVQLHAALTNPPVTGCVLNYTVDTLTYTAATGTFTSITPASFVNAAGLTNSTDDGVAGPFTIPFSFPFYCQSYTKFYVNSNGWISFVNPYANTGDGPWEYTAQTLPPASIPPQMAVELMMGNYNLADGFFGGGGNVKYLTSGTAPNRILVVKFTNMQDENDISTTSGEIHLHEGTGLIDILLKASDYSGTSHTTGVLDSIGIGTAAPGRNNQAYTITTPEAWRFTPAYGANIEVNSTVWSPSTGLLGNDADTLNNPYADPTGTQAYVVTSTLTLNPFGTPSTCVVRDTVKISVNSIAGIATATPDTICPGDTTHLNFTSTGTITSYLWTPAAGLSNPAIADPTASVLDSTTYNVTATTTAGCSATGSVTVHVLPVAHPFIGNDTMVCPAGSATLTLSGGPYSSYQWFSVDTVTGVRTLVSSGAVDSTYLAGIGYYVAEVANGGACSYYSNQIHIDSFPNPHLTIDTSGPVSCVSGSVELYADTGLANIQWVPAGYGSADSIAVSVAGVFSYTATNANGCLYHSNAITVSIGAQGIATATPDTICPGDTTQLNFSSAATISSYIWSPPAGLIGGATTASPKATILDTTTYYVIATTSSGCTISDSITVYTTPVPQLSLGDDTTVCYNDSVLLSLAGSFNSYQWFSVDTLTGARTLVSSGATASSYLAGFGSYVLEVSNGGACSYFTNIVSIDTFTKQAITIDSSGPASFCIGGSVELYADSGLTGIQWTPASFGSADSINVTASGVFSYTADDAHGCLLHSNTLTVTADPHATVSVAVSKNPICGADTSLLVATTTPAGASVIWDVNGVQSAVTGDTFAATAPGSYQAIASPACPGTATVVITAGTPPVVSLGGPINICSCTPDTVIYPAVSPVSASDSFFWSNGTKGDSLALTQVGANTYTVTVTDSNGCAATASIAVTIGCVQIGAYAAPDTVFPTEIFALSSDSAFISRYGYLWSGDSGIIANPSQIKTTATVTNFAPGIDTFQLYVFDSASSCYANTVVYVTVLTQDSFAFPTAFTPNGDGVNDYYYPRFTDTSTMKIISLRIYDRWGQLLYNNPSPPGWDGNYSGSPQMIGTYLIFMTVEYPDPKNAAKQIQQSVEGSFQLFR